MLGIVGAKLCYSFKIGASIATRGCAVQGKLTLYIPLKFGKFGNQN